MAFGAGRIPPWKVAAASRPKPVETTVSTEDASGESCMAEVRFEDAPSASYAIQQLNDREFKGSALKLVLDPQSKDRTKCVVTGVPIDVDWQELKDHFNQVPNVAFVAIIGNKRKSTSGPTLTGEVRFDTPEQAQQAMEVLQSTSIGGLGSISITVDTNSKDNTKLLVTEIPSGVTWQELKAHFMQAAGKVAYANVTPNFAGGMATHMGEVRYDDPTHTAQALEQLNGSELRGGTLRLNFAPGSADQSKLQVHGIPWGTGWQELKDHFAQIGQVAFANVFGPKGNGKGGKGGKADFGGGFGGGCQDWNGPMMPMMMMVPVHDGCGKGGGKGGGKAAQAQMWPPAGKGGYGKDTTFAKPYFDSPYLRGCGPFW